MSKKPAYVVHDNFRMPRGFPVAGFASALRYRPDPGDIFVSTYPKCGTTWVQNIVLLILRNGVPLSKDEKLTDLFPHLEEVGTEGVSALPKPRCIKTHLPFAMTPWHESARYLYVARNPFDCAVSFYHHTRGFPKHYDFADGTFDDFFECFVTGEVDFGDYFENLLGWYEHRGDQNLLFLTYEGMLAEPAASIRSIGRFLAEPAVENPELLGRIVEASSFGSMKKNQDRWSSRRPEDMPAFIRKGVVGDWKNEFSPSQAQRLLQRFDATLGTGIDSLWPDVLAEARALVR